MSKVSPEDLFDGFAPLSKKEWQEITEAGLKGKPYEKLIWKPDPNLSIEPYYTREEIDSLPIHSQPGIYPFRRGNQFNGSKNDWQLVQEILQTEDKRVLDNIQDGLDNEV